MIRAARGGAAARLIVPALLGLAGCAAPPQSCAVPGETGMMVVEMFFGRDIPGRAPLGDAEWADFAATIATPQFPDGFTVLDGDGQWRDPQSGAIVRERAKILLVAVAPSGALGARIDAVRDAYRARFAQASVGLLTTPACGAF